MDSWSFAEWTINSPLSYAEYVAADVENPHWAELVGTTMSILTNLVADALLVSCASTSFLQVYFNGDACLDLPVLRNLEKPSAAECPGGHPVGPIPCIGGLRDWRDRQKQGPQCY